jgi:hypothetical protein
MRLSPASDCISGKDTHRCRCCCSKVGSGRTHPSKHPTQPPFYPQNTSKFVGYHDQTHIKTSTSILQFSSMTHNVLQFIIPTITTLSSPQWHQITHNSTRSTPTQLLQSQSSFAPPEASRRDGRYYGPSLFEGIERF